MCVIIQVGWIMKHARDTTFCLITTCDNRYYPTMLKRLIEVALPLKEVSEQSAREKSIRHGHISTLRIWWARRPLAACRAAVFASLIPDPDDLECPADFRSLVMDLLKHERYRPRPKDEGGRMKDETKKKNSSDSSFL